MVRGVTFDLTIRNMKSFILEILHKVWFVAEFLREPPFSGVGVGEHLILDKESKNS